MSNVKVINIVPEYEVILGFLFPEYTITDSAAVTSKFITHRTVKSKAEREALDWQYADCIFISTQIFDEVWDEEKIKQECIEFSRLRFKNRKKTINTTKEAFAHDCINFIFGVSNIEEESAITELFDSFGSQAFPQKFFKLCEELSYQQVVAAMITFISKIKKDSTSVFYKKKAMLLEDKLNSNMLTAIDAYNLGINADNGVLECSLFMNLVK